MDYFLAIMAIVGTFVAPVFTIGCILINYDHHIIGGLIVLWSIITNERTANNDTVKKQHEEAEAMEEAQIIKD